MGCRTLAAACFLFLALNLGAQTRFGRAILEPDDRASYAMTRIDEFDAAARASDGYEVSCLVYRESARLYVELEIRNRTPKDLAIARDFVSIQQGSRKLQRTRTSTIAREVETEALRPFVPKAGDGESGDAQAKRHAEQQEVGLAFASLLQTFAQESGPPVLAAKEDQTIVCTFEPPRNDRDLIEILIRIGDEEFPFRFRPTNTAKR